MIIKSNMIEAIDNILDKKVGQLYHDQPLAQDWARISKGIEEQGESIAELILLTGQNPRKGKDNTARERLHKELADSALTFIYALQHFTKDIDATNKVIEDRLSVHFERLSCL